MTEARFLRSKALRNALWIAAEGKCQMCGCDLPEDWHADHIMPWAAGGETTFSNLRALCPACNLKRGKGFMEAEFESYLQINQAEFRARLAQVQAFRWAAATQEIGLGKDVRKRAELVTGYGKTLLAYGVFGVLRARGFVDRMLVLVPGDEQRSQFCDDEVKAKRMLGLTCPAQPVSKKSVDLIYNKRGERVVFVGTYAQCNDAFFASLIEDRGKWMIVADECHHLSEDNLWGERVEALPAALRLYMSATPIRSDRKGLRGVPDSAESLIAQVNYQTAFGEEAVKQVVCCNEHYRVLCEDESGGTFPVTTSDLLAAKIKDFSTYEAKRQLRYNQDYLWELLLNPLSLLSQKRAQHHPTAGCPPRHQMLVFAMSCRHASYICDAIRSVCQSIGYSLSCEWVGVGDGYGGDKKSDKENSDIIDRYRAGVLDILVSVDKVGEGFSVNTASVLVFLNLLSADAKLLQQIGRGLRRNYDIPFKEDHSHIFCGSDSEVSRIVAVMDQIRRDARDPLETDSRAPQQGSLWDIPDITVIQADHSHREVITPVTPQDVASCLTDYDLAFCQKHNLDPVEFYRHQIGRAGLAPCGLEVDDGRSSREKLEAVKTQTNTATTTLVGNIIRLMRRLGHPINPQTAGKVKKSVNGEWVRRSGTPHDSMGENEYRAKHAWLKAENDALREGKGIPSWIN